MDGVLLFLEKGMHGWMEFLGEKGMDELIVAFRRKGERHGWDELLFCLEKGMDGITFFGVRHGWN